MKTVNDIRTEFLTYFTGQGHEIVPSSPLVPQNDPTLMFVNSGMVQFKDLFTGKETRSYTRATSAQKCVRAGGKHNDLDNVGYTARHHTFFEMMGNFSFGDYFKEEAIPFAWELITKNFGLSPEKLLITVHSSDEEAATIWKKVTGFSDDKIIRIPTSDNFWSMGDTGPCGPCTEIFYDHGADIPGGPPGSPDEDGDRFIEIWNVVFMQFEQIDKDTRIDLPKTCVDTGMGLERVAAILQGKHDNYDIDLFHALIEHSADLTGIGTDSVSHRVIADHLRCAAFLIADGILPGNEGRGYVLRRIMRRGMRHAHLLGTKEPLMHRLFPTLAGLMGEAYPELRRAEDLITETLKMEETRFGKTLDRGLKMLDEETEKISSGKQFPGDVAFKLYDTYGFPVDLTQDALRAKGIAVDMKTFESCMEKQRTAARKNWAGSGDSATEKLWFELREELGPTEFLGYETENAEGQILAIVKDGKKVDTLKQGEEGIIITNQTPFYGESGGQTGDTGELVTPGKNQLNVTDTQKKLNSLFLHYVTCKNGDVTVKDSVEMHVDNNRRTAIRANHSATHLLHAALRNHLGKHISQKGSLVDANKLRFDISHPKHIEAAEMAAIEEEVNREIRANTKARTRLMPVDEAKEAGAMALFGEKYDDEVRVLTMGTTDPETGKPFSVELCGGTHVRRTGDIGLLKITSESALAAGVRRIEALTGASALSYLEEQNKRLHDISDSIKASPAEAVNRVKTLAAEKKKLEQEVSTLRRQIATGSGATDTGPDVKEIGGIKFTAKVLDDFPPKDLKPMADDLKAKLGSGVITLIAVNEGRASLVVGVTDDLTDKINAVELVKAGAAALGGKGGGGRPDMAQAGGPDGNAANDAVTAIEKELPS